MQDPNNPHKPYTQNWVRANERYEDDMRRSAGPPACFPEATPIAVPGGTRPIGSIRVGDRVLAASAASADAGGLRPRPVVAVHRVQGASLWRIRWSGEAPPVTTTAHHAFRTQRGWIRSGRLRPGDRVRRLACSGAWEWAEVRAAGPVDATADVFNLIVERDLTFVAAGCLVHSFAYARAPRVAWHRLCQAVLLGLRPMATAPSYNPASRNSFPSHPVRVPMHLSKFPATLAIFALALFFFSTAAQAQVSPIGRLNSGSSFKGRISPAFDVDTYTFEAMTGEGILLRMADLNGTDLAPQMNVYGPDGSLVAWTWSGSVAALGFAAPASGLYTLVVMDNSSGGSDDTGVYEIHYTRAPGANEHGPLVNGSFVTGNIGLGDLDSFTFDALLGEAILLRMVDSGLTGLSPQMNVYGPDGSLVAWTWSGVVAGLDFAAPVTGVYTLVVMDNSSGGFDDMGAYEIHYARLPGANEHGQLVNGGSVTGFIDMGDLDTFVFDAGQGEGILLRMVDSGQTGLSPQMNVYGPDGSLVAWTWSGVVAGLDFAAPVTGVYTLVVMDNSSGGFDDMGAYEIHYARLPGANEHGQLVNGGSVTGSIDMGDLDSFIFDAAQGEEVLLRMVDSGLTGLSPQMNVYGPDGSLVAWTWSGIVAGLDFAAPVTGVYTLVVMDNSSGGFDDVGAYEIHYTRLPGANEHGQLVNGGSVAGFIDMGDLDSFIFDAAQGEEVLLRMVDSGLTGLSPQMNVYGPDGSLVAWTWSGIVAGLGFAAPVTGVYTLVVMDNSSGGFDDIGAYEIHYTRAPGANEHGLLASGTVVTGFIDMGDLDSFTFDAIQGEGIQLQMTDTGGTDLSPQMNVFAPDGSLAAWTWGGSVATLNFSASATGVFTLVVMDNSSSGFDDTGAYDLSFIRL
jgi:hypothetical protein